MNISKKILRAINEGVLNALSFDDELPDTEDVTMHRIGNDNATNHLNKELDKLYYSLKLQEMLPDAFQVKEIKIHELTKFIHLAIEWHEKYGATYNPHLDGKSFKTFISTCLLIPYSLTLDLNWIDTSEVTEMISLFRFSDFKGDISEWDVSNVTNMYMMFRESQFNGDISKWDVSNVEDMSYMFCMATFNKPIGNWDVSHVTNMDYMFCNAKKFNLDISKWNVSNIADMSYIFYGCPIKEEYRSKKL